VNLFAIDPYVARCVDTDTHLVALDGQYRDRDVFPYYQFFINTSCKYQHECPLSPLAILKFFCFMVFDSPRHPGKQKTIRFSQNTC
jgi:hypothetical protein